MIYCITDGQENASHITNSKFKKLIKDNAEKVTVAAFVPGINSLHTLENLGIPKGNIEKWDTSAQGLEEVGIKFEKTMNNYFDLRSSGVKVSSSVFSDLNTVKVKDVKKVAKTLKKKDYKIVVNEKVKAVQIKPLVEDKAKVTYRKGMAFYELVKNEHVQDTKEIAVQDKKTGTVYKGYEARQMLNLPQSGKVKVNVADFDNKKWIVYIQSGSVNRNVIPKQRVLVVL